ncbi:hypothetical protein K2173_006098 [Erythroxylum novogranatense]|uniref:Uncharacterized protein n=1 Tax=Erythroxylum novogranatense TaxID=1862640 RepID=A0AAV8TE09_9ROSI|nr:hypothetical protein K2173_006098 [Erythroxylum novogranatense]
MEEAYTAEPKKSRYLDRGEDQLSAHGDKAQMKRLKVAVLGGLQEGGKGETFAFGPLTEFGLEQKWRDNITKKKLISKDRFQ